MNISPLRQSRLLLQCYQISVVFTRITQNPLLGAEIQNQFHGILSCGITQRIRMRGAIGSPRCVCVCVCLCAYVCMSVCACVCMGVCICVSAWHCLLGWPLFPRIDRLLCYRSYRTEIYSGICGPSSMVLRSLSTPGVCVCAVHCVCVCVCTVWVWMRVLEGELVWVSVIVCDWESMCGSLCVCVYFCGCMWVREYECAWLCCN